MESQAQPKGSELSPEDAERMAEALQPSWAEFFDAVDTAEARGERLAPTAEPPQAAPPAQAVAPSSTGAQNAAPEPVDEAPPPASGPQAKAERKPAPEAARAKPGRTQLGIGLSDGGPTLDTRPRHASRRALGKGSEHPNAEGPRGDSPAAPEILGDDAAARFLAAAAPADTTDAPEQLASSRGSIDVSLDSVPDEPAPAARVREEPDGGAHQDAGYAHEPAAPLPLAPRSQARRGGARTSPGEDDAVPSMDEPVALPTQNRAWLKLGLAGGAVALLGIVLAIAFSGSSSDVPRTPSSAAGVNAPNTGATATTTAVKSPPPANTAAAPTADKGAPSATASASAGASAATSAKASATASAAVATTAVATTVAPPPVTTGGGPPPKGTGGIVRTVPF